MTDFLSAIELLSTSKIGWGDALLHGALATLQISLGAFAVSICLGIAVALIKTSRWGVLRAIANGYVTVCRAIPELLLIILLYYAGTTGLERLVSALGWSERFEVSGFAAAVIILGLVQGAYASEIVRGAIAAIPPGPLEAGRAFAMTPLKVFSRVTFPLMLPLALAGLGNTWVVLLKDSALIGVVGYAELLQTANQAAASTKMYFFFYLVAAAIYLSITLVSNFVFRRVERHARRGLGQI